MKRKMPAASGLVGERSGDASSIPVPSLVLSSSAANLPSCSGVPLR